MIRFIGTMHRPTKIIGKWRDLHYEMLKHPPYLPHLPLSLNEENLPHIKHFQELPERHLINWKIAGKNLLNLQKIVPKNKCSQEP